MGPAPTRLLRGHGAEGGVRMPGSDVPLLLVDGHNLLYRAWFGFPARIWSRDRTRDLTGVFGFFALLRVAARELPAPPEIVVVFDGERGWEDRLALHPSYKTHRPDDDEAMAPIRSLASVHTGLDALGLARPEVETAEADDVIATICARCAGRLTWIMSVDRDFYQLVDDRVRILNTTRRSGQREIESKHIEERFGVRPEQWCDRAALVGDRSDGIPGVRGIGPVTAARLLADGRTLEDLPGSPLLTPRLARLILESYADTLARRDLMRLRVDIDVLADLTAKPSATLPLAAEVVRQLDLW